MDAFNNIQAHYGSDDLDRCAKQQWMSDDITMPCHHVRRIFALLTSIVVDAKEAEDYYAQAEAPFHIVRAWHTIGDDAEGDGHLDEASGLLDETGSVLLKVRPNNTVGRYGHIEERERRIREEAKRNSKE
jgi:hypothetical protein